MTTSRAAAAACALQRGSGRAAPSGEGDGGDQPAVIRLAAMGGATVGEESRFVGVGAEAERGRLRDAEPLQPGDDVARQVEQEVAGPRSGREETIVGFALGAEGGEEFAADLI